MLGTRILCFFPGSLGSLCACSCPTPPSGTKKLSRWTVECVQASLINSGLTKTGNPGVEEGITAAPSEPHWGPWVQGGERVSPRTLPLHGPKYLLPGGPCGEAELNPCAHCLTKGGLLTTLNRHRFQVWVGCSGKSKGHLCPQV